MESPGTDQETQCALLKFTASTDFLVMPSDVGLRKFSGSLIAISALAIGPRCLILPIESVSRLFIRVFDVLAKKSDDFG